VKLSGTFSKERIDWAGTKRGRGFGLFTYFRDYFGGRVRKSVVNKKIMYKFVD
jgi:hypothetical protein